MVTYVFPQLSCSSHNSVSGGFSLTSFVVSLGNLSDILNGHEIPDTVTCHDQNLIVILQQKVFDLRLRNHSNFVSEVISKRACQVKPSHVILIRKDSELSLEFLASRISLFTPIRQVARLQRFFFRDRRLFSHDRLLHSFRDAAPKALYTILLPCPSWNMVLSESPYLPKLVHAD